MIAIKRLWFLILVVFAGSPVLAYDAGLLTAGQYDVQAEVVEIPVQNVAVTRDSTHLVGTLYRPVERDGSAPLPAQLPVVFVTTPYGRGGGSVVPGGDGSAIGEFYASRGYLVLITDNRGTGDSQGALEFAKIEVEDAVDTIEWLKGREDVNAERIGMKGCSYLGGMQVLTAARKPGLRTIVPQAAWYDLERAALPGGTPKTVVDALIIGIFAERELEPTSDGMPHTIDPVEATIPLQSLLALNPYLYPIGAVNHEEYRERSVWPSVEQIDIPVYLIISWQDDLIEVDQTLDLWRGVSSAEKKMTIGSGGHCAWTAATREAEHAWLDHYLMDIENGIEADPPIDYVVRGTEGPEVETSPAWPVPGISEEVLYLRAGDTPNQGMLSGTPPPDAEPSNRITNVYAAGFNDGLQAVAQDSLLPDTVPRNTAAETAVYSLALPEGLQVTGTPRVSLAVRPSAHQVQYAAKLYEVRTDGSRALVTRGIYTTFDEILAPARVEFDLFSTSYRFAPGSTLELAVANSDVGYVLPSPVPSTTEIRHTPDAASWLQLPVAP